MLNILASLGIFLLKIKVGCELMSLNISMLLLKLIPVIKSGKVYDIPTYFLN